MKTDKLFYGAAYYDEYMPYDRIDEDFAMMERAGMNIIRIAESTWSSWEPKEGQFNFSHLHRMLDCAKKHNLSVIVGTPTYAIPSWLSKKSDDILALTHDGQEIYGRRQNMDITNPIYLDHARIIIERLMSEVVDHPNVIGFQLDNETKSYDTCSPRAQAMFVEELKQLYPDINDFNHEFGLNYWSNRIECWEDFPDVRGTINQSLHAEYRRFQRKLVTNFLSWQSDIVAKYKRKDQFITQNFDFEWHDYSFGLQPEVDQYQASKCLTVAGCDIYHPSQDKLTGCEITACGNITRGLMDDNYLVLETEAQGNIEWLSYPGQLRLQAYSHIANGSNMVEYWHWHSIHNAIESYWKGVLSHDFSENRTYRECSVIGNEWKRIGHKLKNLKKQNKVAIIVDNASLTALMEFPTQSKGKASYNTVFRWLADALYNMNIEYDVIPAEPDKFDSYDYLLLPAYYCAPQDILIALDDYVKKGGNLIATFKSGFSDEHIKIYHDVQPHIIKNALGIHYDQYTYPVDVEINYKNIVSPASEWMELIYCDSATSLANYSHKVWGEYAAVTSNKYGKGNTLYLATRFGENTLIEILKDFFTATNYHEENKYNFDVDKQVYVKQGINDYGHHIVYLLNYSDQTKTARNIAKDATELIQEQAINANSTIIIEPWNLVILEY